MGRAEDLFERLRRDGLAAIEEMIAKRAAEELFLDIKRSSDRGAGTRLSQNDRDNLARAISGFGNSEGGVVVWGVECSPDDTGADLARAGVPLEDPQRLLRGWKELLAAVRYRPTRTCDIIRSLFRARTRAM